MKRNILTGAVLGLGLAFAAVQGASAADVPLDLRSTASPNGTFSGASNSNTLTYTNVGGIAGLTMSITAWYTPTPTSNFARTNLGQYSPGLGVCDPGDNNCAAPQHEVDNHGYTDWVLISFSSAVNLKSVVLDPVGSYDTDAEYYIGNSLTSLTGLNLASLGTATQAPDSGAPNTALHTITFGANGTAGTYLLIGAQEPVVGTDGYPDYFKIKSLTVDPTTTRQQQGVPEPVTWMFMILGFAGLAFTRRRSAVRA